MMRVIGTAGHVDHGKSTLVRLLTGIEPDRLAEEQKRKLTIDLGFAWIPIEDGHIGIIDVPGHRDFIENMLAGIGGIDGVLLVIAADEGVMPQTREHLAIIHLLGISTGLIVLTKTDLVDDPEWIDLITADIRQVTKGTRLEQAPIVLTAANNPAQIANLKQMILAMCADMPPRKYEQYPFLPIDRVFTMSGFGTVVTGTLSGGTLHVGDQVSILPKGLSGRIRGIQRYKDAVDSAITGSRVAININGVSVDDIQRGDVLTTPGHYQATQLIDVYFEYLPDVEYELEHATEVKFFSGTCETVARIRLLGKERLQPGEFGWLQLKLRDAITVRKGDRYILRVPSPANTIGGGIVVAPHPERLWRRFDPEVIDYLDMLLVGSPLELIQQATTMPQSLSQIQQKTGLDIRLIEKTLHDDEQETIHELPNGLRWSAQSITNLATHMIASVRTYHAGNPLKMGMPQEELRHKLDLSPAAFAHLLKIIPSLISYEHLIADVQHTIQFTPQQQQEREQVIDLLQQQPYTPPSRAELLSITTEDMLHAMTQQRDITAINQEIVFLTSVYEQVIQTVFRLIDIHGKVDAKALRDELGSSRKYSVALLEHFDGIGMTKRVGDDRVKGRNAPVE